MRVTREDVDQIIGEVDEFILDKILAVGATRAELREAALAAVMDYEMGERTSPPSTFRVDALCLIIERLLKLEEDDELTDPGSYAGIEDDNDKGRW